MRWDWPLVALVVIVSYLCLVRLDNTPLWEDESEDATIGRNLLHTGKLTGWDGRNLYCYLNGTILDEQLLYRNPPLPPLVTAASFAIFGVSTWSARLPFALMGIAAMAVMIAAFREAFPGNRPGAFYAAALIGLSPEFLLNARQCRYYMPSLLMGLVVYWAYSRFLRTRSTAALAAIAGGVAVFFYSNWMLCAGFLGSLATLHLLFHAKELRRGDWSRLAVAIAAVLIATVPYAVAHRIWDRPDFDAAENLGWGARKLTLLYWNIREMNLINVAPWTMVIVLAAFLWRARKQPGTGARAALQWMALGLLNLVWITVFSPQHPATTYLADIRYLVAGVPFFYGAIGWALGRIHQVARPAAVFVLLVLLSSNALSALPGGGWSFYWMLPAYVKEIHQPYPTSVGETAKYLEAHAGHDDLVYLNPIYLNFPVMFYAGDKVRFCVIDRTSKLPEAKIRQLGAPLYLDENFPDWVILFSDQSAKEIISYFSRPFTQNGQTVAYQYRLADIINVYYDETSRPEIPLHNFGPVTKFYPPAEGVLVFRKTGSRAIR